MRKMRKSTTKTTLKTMLGVLLLLSGMSVMATNNTATDPLKDSIVVKAYKTDSAAHLETLKPIQRPNPMEKIFDVLPEVFESFGLTERKFDVSLRLMSHNLSKKMTLLNKFADKQSLSPDSKAVKQLLRDLNLKIGGSNFETRELKPEFVAKFTDENVRKVVTVLSTLKQSYDSSIKQKTLKAKFEVFKSIPKNPKSLKDLELLTAITKEYSGWVTGLMSIKGTNTQLGDSVQIRKRKLEKEAIKKHDQQIYDKAYTLTSEQIKISTLPYNGGNESKIVRIESGEKETKVTFALPIHYDWNWISTDSLSCLIDKQTNDYYYPRNIDSNIPLNRIIIVKNCKNKMIEITYIYPPLKKSVIVIDQIDLPGSSVELPSNSGKSTEFQNIFVDDYTGRVVLPRGNVYR